MIRNILLGLTALLAVLILADVARHGAPRPAPPPSSAIPPAIPAQSQPASRIVAILPGQASAMTPPTETPALDMEARLATRRRIAREGNRIYIDSAFAHTDSVVARWADRTTLNVALLRDSSLAGWSPSLLDEARAAMHAWDGAGSGLTLREVAPGDSADITVRWVDVLTDSGQVGNTTLRWTPDGVAHAATILLALHRNSDGAVVPPAARARIAIHEFGHALGLPHSDSSDDIMYRTSPVVAPSLRDQATLRLLYVLFPGSIRVQP